MLKLPQVVTDAMKIQAQETYPEECCGLLLGVQTSQAKIVRRIYPTPNSWQPQLWQNLDTVGASRRNRFSIDPLVLLQGQKDARQEQLDIIGIYHSHPDHPAIPSEFDRAIAHQIYSYVILSVNCQAVTKLSSWVLNQASQFQSEEIVTI